MGRRAKRNAANKVRKFRDAVAPRFNRPVEQTATEILARPASGDWFDSRCAWSANDLARLKLLAEAKADPEKSADALYRTPTSLAWKAKESGIILPPAWRALIRPARKPAAPRIEIAYPYIVKARPEHAVLMRANALVPRGFPSHMRADICQSVMLAMYEGQTTIAELEQNAANLQWFTRKFYAEQRPWQELTGIGGEDDERDYADIAYSLSAYRTHTSDAEIIDYVYEREIDRAQEAAFDIGEWAEREEIEHELSQRRAASDGSSLVATWGRGTTRPRLVPATEVKAAGSS